MIHRVSLHCLRLLLLFVATAGAGCQDGLRTTESRAPLFGRRGEPWTIECLVVRGPERRSSTEAVGDVLRQTPGISPEAVRVRHQPEASTIYYQTHHRKIDRYKGTREIPKALREDLAMVKELVDDRGRNLFIGARMVPQPLPVKGRREWNLEHADGRYTLQVAAFFTAPEVPNYRQAAVDYASDLRRRGYEAYYYHGDSNSVVTIGAFGPEALVRRGGTQHYSDKVRALQRQETFVYNLTNGRIWHQVVGGRKAPVGSRLVRIPRRETDQP